MVKQKLCIYVYKEYTYWKNAILIKIIITECLELPEYLQSHQTKMSSPEKKQAFEHNVRNITQSNNGRTRLTKKTKRK